MAMKKVAIPDDVYQRAFDHLKTLQDRSDFGVRLLFPRGVDGASAPQILSGFIALACERSVNAPPTEPFRGASGAFVEHVRSGGALPVPALPPREPEVSRIYGKKADVIIADELVGYEPGLGLPAVTTRGPLVVEVEEAGTEAAGLKSPEPEYDWRKDRPQKFTFAEDREERVPDPVAPPAETKPTPAPAPKPSGGLAKQAMKLRQRVVDDELAGLRAKFPGMSDDQLKMKLDSAKRKFHQTVADMQAAGEPVNGAGLPRAYDGTLLEEIPQNQRDEMDRWTRCYCAVAEEMGLVWSPGDPRTPELEAEVRRRMK